MRDRLRKVSRMLIAVLMMMVLVTGSAFLDNNAVSAVAWTAPGLKSLQYYQEANGSYTAQIYWNARKGKTYEILRHKAGQSGWQHVAYAKGKGKKTSYKNTNVGLNTYTYTVRQVTVSGGQVTDAGSFDTEGLTTLPMANMNVTFNTLNAYITWDKVEGADKYLIYRRYSKGEKNKLIATVSGNRTSYTDVYRSSYKQKKMKKILTSDYFVDPSNNPLIYTVRPYYARRTGAGTYKESYGMYLRDGFCHLEPPTITTLSSSGDLTWGTVPNADGYVVLTRSGTSGEWTTLHRFKRDKKVKTYQTRKVSYNRNNYYAVQAYTYRNGRTQYSDIDPLFTKKNSGVGYGKNVLFLGDSMTFGSPYYGKERMYFAYPRRIQQLTGIRYFNPSIPGSTWSYHGTNNRYRIVNSVAGMIRLGHNTNYAFKSLKVGKNKQKFEDFDIVILAAGTNDYQDIAKVYPGSRETDWTKITNKTRGISFTVNAGTKYKKRYKNMNYDYNIYTYNGAYNQIYKYIEEASINRVLAGKPPIKVVSIGLFYSDRTYPYYKVTNRNITRNRIGLTLPDYQKEMDYLNAQWAKSPVLDVYSYDSQAAGIVDSSNCGTMSSDNLHFSKFTYGLYGDNIADFMIQNGVFRTRSAAEINVIKGSAEFNALRRKYGK